MKTPFTIGRRPTDNDGDWQTFRIKDFSTYVNRGVAPKYVDGEIETGFVAFSQKCVLPNGQVNSELGRPMEEPDVAAADAVLDECDIVINSTGTGTLGRAGIVRSLAPDAPVAVADGHVTIVRVETEHVLPEYLAYLLGTEAFNAVANECLAVGSTNQMELGRDSIRTLGVEIPHLDEQRALVRILDVETRRIDETIRELESQIALLQEHREALITAAVTGQLEPEKATI
jgi:type I restriction enzyme S subunit